MIHVCLLLCARLPLPTPTGVNKTGGQNNLPFKNPSTGDSAVRAGLKGNILALRTSTREADERHRELTPFLTVAME